MDQNRLRRLNLRLTQQEWDKIHRLAANSTCRSTSEYARKVLSQKPVRVFYRNQSFDDFEERMLRLLPELNTANQNFAEALKTLADFKKNDSSVRLAQFETYAEILFKKVYEIKEQIQKLSDNETQNNQLQQHSQVTDL
jgi:MobC-like protein